jgi:pyruvate formate lyase activating enzyme
MSATRGLVADVVRASCVDGPGNRYVLFLQGCTFNCIACHTPYTIPRRSTTTTSWRSVDEVLADIAEVSPFLSGVTVSGGEATAQWQFVHELFERLALDPATSHLTRLVDSNGDAEPIAWDTLAMSMHGAMIDLKALDQEVHRDLTGRDNDRVLASIEQLARLHRLSEVRLLIIPGVNDERSQLDDTARWLGALDPVPPVVVLGFRREGTRPVARVFAEASAEDLERVAATLVESGLEPDLVAVRRSSPAERERSVAACGDGNVTTAEM